VAHRPGHPDPYGVEGCVRSEPGPRRTHHGIRCDRRSASGGAGNASCWPPRPPGEPETAPQTRALATAADLVDRQFTTTEPGRLWVTDITEHPTREGKVYCAVVLDTFSRRVVGWSIDSSPTSTLVTSALGMAINNRDPDGTIIHSDQGTQLTSWAFTHRAQQSGLMPSMGSVGDCYDNAMVESVWAGTHVELVNRKRWGTRIELANAIFEYLEIFHNRQRRHSALGMHTPIEYERIHQEAPPVALSSQMN